MKTMYVSGMVHVQEKYKANSFKDAVKKFKRKHRTNPEYVGAKEVVGVCEGCDKPIMDYKDFHSSEDIELCTGCAKEEGWIKATINS